MSLLICEREVVINARYGGFHLDTEMAIWLMENKNWVVGKNKDLEDCGFDYYMPPQNTDEIAFRMNPDLIECVCALKEIHKNDVYPDSYYGHIHTLKIEKVKVYIGVENVNDGKEKITCWTEE